MNIIISRIELTFRLIQLRWAEVFQNPAIQQAALEEIVAIHIRLQIAREQSANRSLFTNV